MSTGFGIIIGTALLIAAWQIDKQNLWRRSWRVALALAAISVITVAACWVYDQSLLREQTKQSQKAEEDRRKAEEDKKRDEAAAVHNPGKLTYWGITLGMSKAQVRYTKGKPFIEWPATTERLEKWLYLIGENGYGSYYYIYWDRASSTVNAVNCQGPRPETCPRLFGIGPESSEQEVRSEFGAPDKEGQPDENGDKLLVYGTGKDTLKLGLRLEHVVVMSLGRSMTLTADQ